MVKQPKHVASGLLSGGLHLGRGIFNGVTGIIRSPIEGAIHDGATGFVKGVGLGLLGVVIKPVAGALDGVATLTDGIKNTTTLFDKQIKPQRATRILYGPDQLLKAYTPKELAAACFLNHQGQIKLEKHQLETYLDHFVVEMRVVKKSPSSNNSPRMLQQQFSPAVNNNNTIATPSSAADSSDSSPNNAANSPYRTQSFSTAGGAGLYSPRSITPNNMNNNNNNTTTNNPTVKPTKSSPVKEKIIQICYILTDHSLLCARLQLNKSKSQLLWSYYWTQIQAIHRINQANIQLKVLKQYFTNKSSKAMGKMSQSGFSAGYNHNNNSIDTNARLSYSSNNTSGASSASNSPAVTPGISRVSSSQSISSMPQFSQSSPYPSSNNYIVNADHFIILISLPDSTTADKLQSMLETAMARVRAIQQDQSTQLLTP